MVGRGGLSPSYFFEEMTFSEAEHWLEGYQERKKDEWERTRMLMWIVAQVNSRSELSPDDVMKFPWDEVQGPSDEAEIRELRERVKNFKL